MRVPDGLVKRHGLYHHVQLQTLAIKAEKTLPHGLNRYWLRHVVAGLIEVPVYAMYRQRYELAVQCIVTEALYLSLLRLLWVLNPVATFWVFLLPFLTTSLALMFGNWCASLHGCPK